MAAPQTIATPKGNKKVKDKKRTAKEWKAMREALDIAFPPVAGTVVVLKGAKWHAMYDEYKSLNRVIADSEARVEEIKYLFAQEMGSAVEGQIPAIGQSMMRDMAHRDSYTVEAIDFRKCQFQKSTPSA